MIEKVTVEDCEEIVRKITDLCVFLENDKGKQKINNADYQKILMCIEIIQSLLSDVPQRKRLFYANYSDDDIDLLIDEIFEKQEQ